MDIFNAGMQPFFGKRLDRREVELRHLIDSTNQLRHEADEAGPNWPTPAPPPPPATADVAATPANPAIPMGPASEGA